MIKYPAVLFSIVLIVHCGISQNTFSSSGNVGIGITNPYHLLNIVGDGKDVAHTSFNSNVPGNRPDYWLQRARGTQSSKQNVVINDQLGSFSWQGWSGNFKNGTHIMGVVDETPLSGYMPTRIEFHTATNTSGTLKRMVIKSNGDVGIGTSEPDAMLTVKGDIHAQEVKVDLLGALAPDYVFKEDYQLMRLEEISAYVKKHNHLPEVPGAENMQRNGLELKAMNLLLLKKIEELTLYLIDQENRIKALTERLNDL